MIPSYRIIRSRRRTISLQVTGEGLVVRAPLRVSASRIDAFVREHEDWIEKQLGKAQQARAAADEAGILSPEELRALAERAKTVIPERVRFFAPMVGVSYGRITIRSQRTKWGSCSSKGNLNFNCLLLLAPLGVLDSVVVHELCHRKEMNHSRAFYAEVTRVLPDYREREKWLKEHGRSLLARLPQNAGSGEES